MTIKHINRLERLYRRHATKEKGEWLVAFAIAAVVVAFILIA